MTSIVRLQYRPDGEQEAWLEKHLGPRLHWLPQSVGGERWRAELKPILENEAITGWNWELKFADDKMSTFFALHFNTL